MEVSTSSAHDVLIAVRDSSAVGQTRRAAAVLAELAGLDETARGELALIVTEICTNILQHAKDGEVLLRPVTAGRRGVEVLALDKGPGMANVAECLQDGYSTGGSRGAGLGSIRRLADRFDIYSREGAGTALVAERSTLMKPPSRRRSEVGAVCIPYPGETVIGDAWLVADFPDRTVAMVVDGLGHGLLAHEAAQRALGSFEKHGHLSPVRALEAIHGDMSATRGAAAAIACIHWGNRTVAFSGVGNISGVVLGDGERAHGRGLSSHNGIVGGARPRFQEFEHPWPQEGLLVLHSDGVSSRWGLEAYPGLAMKAPSLIAGVLLRDHGRPRDDATVLVVRERDAQEEGARTRRGSR